MFLLHRLSRAKLFIDGQGIAQVVGANDFGQRRRQVHETIQSHLTSMPPSFLRVGIILFIKQDGTFWGMGRNDSADRGWFSY